MKTPKAKQGKQSQLVTTETATPEPRRRIRETDAEEIAKITARGLNESEACALLGIKRETWYAWKGDHADKYSHIFTRIRGNRIDNLLKEVETAAAGDPARGIRHDWRAADRLLAISAPDRFSQRQETGTVNNTAIVVAAGGEEGLRKLVDLFSKQAAQATAAPAALPQPSSPAAGVALDAEIVPGD
jgi:hypothetical protein